MTELDLDDLLIIRLIMTQRYEKAVFQWGQNDISTVAIKRANDRLNDVIERMLEVYE